MAPRDVTSPDVADEVRRAFGLAVAVTRQRRKLSQRQLADRTQIGRARLSRIEGGKGDATIEIQWRLAKALGLTVPQLWEQAAVEERAWRAAEIAEGKRESAADGTGATVTP